MKNEQFSWVQTHKELAAYLKDKEGQQKELVELLRNAGVTAGLVDEEPKGIRFDLEEIDPFSFFCFIYKYGPDKRLQILQNIASELDLHYPEDELGIPSAQAQKVMMFPFKDGRNNNEIENLWQLFYSSLNDSVTDEQFEEVLNQYGVGPVKITEALFYVAPQKYLPINGPTKPYLEKVFGIDPLFSTWQEYLDLLDKIKVNTEMPFYELSYEAWVWNEERKKEEAELAGWLELVVRYKTHLRENNNLDEIYKWVAIQHFQETFNPDADDFASNLKDSISKSHNLLYQNSKGFITKAVEYNPDKVSEMFNVLYDEDEPLQDRVQQFVSRAEELEPIVSEKHGKSLNHQQDERTLSFYLTMKYPDRYPLYKDETYQYLISQLPSEKPNPAGKKFFHYLEIGEKLIPTIEGDDELFELATQNLTDDCYNGEQKWLVYQDILWINKRSIDSNLDTNYWLFQGNPKIYNLKKALQENALTSWRVNAHKGKITPGDKVILWASGDQRGCYALAEVDSEVYEDVVNEGEEPYYNQSVDGKPYDQVQLRITHNLATQPITEDQIKSEGKLSNLNIGNQGTNFTATREEYEELLKMAELKHKDRKYWLYSPGSQAEMWDEFYNAGIMAIGWDELGDLKKYNSKDEVVERLQEIFETDSSKKNDATANWDLLREISKGDVIIAKRGRSEYLGYGIVTSDYFYDDNRTHFKKCRKVDWKKKGVWVDPRGDIVVKTLTDITPYEEYVDRIKKLIGLEDSGRIPEKVDYPLNTIFYGPPGTGKTYNTVKRAAEIVEQRKIDSYVEAQEIFNECLGDTIEFITFHQNYSYEDFIQGLRPDTEHNDELTFERVDGVFKKLADRALKNLKDSRNPQTKKKSFEKVFNEYVDPLVQGEVEELEVEMKRVSYFITAVTNRSIEFRKASGDSTHTLSISTLRKMYDAESVLEIQGLASYYKPLLKVLLDIGKSPGETELVERKNYVLIIDEINRANISRVFGELITLIEPDKRSEGEFSLTSKLPSGEDFTVPSNLFIIGTMNTADKSIALLDIALRRRFEFEAMYPKYEIDGEYIQDVDILRKINERIIKLKGHDFQIGHSYFMNNEITLKHRMNRKVIPLLLEYFMNDEKEVLAILNHAGLKLKEGENVWPLEITGRA